MVVGDGSSTAESPAASFAAICTAAASAAFLPGLPAPTRFALRRPL
jgi:hypothetical protein